MSNEKIRQDVLTYMESHATHPVSYDDLGRDLRYKGKGLGALWTEIELMIKDGLGPAAGHGACHRAPAGHAERVWVCCTP